MILLQAPFAGGFRDALFYLERIGLRDVILPFLLIFAVIYAVLQRTKIFGGKKKGQRPNIIVALVISLLAVIPHALGIYSEGVDVVNIINQALPEVALLIIIVVMVMLLTGLLAGGDPGKTGFKSLIALLGVIGLVIVFLRAFTPGYTPQWLSFLDDPGFQSLVIVLLVFGLIIWFVTRETPDPNDANRFDLKKFFLGDDNE